MDDTCTLQEGITGITCNENANGEDCSPTDSTIVLLETDITITSITANDAATSTPPTYTITTDGAHGIDLGIWHQILIGHTGDNYFNI